NDYEYYENTYNSFTLPLYSNCSFANDHVLVIFLKFTQIKEKVYVKKIGQDPAPYVLDKHKYRYLDKTLKKIDKNNKLKEDLDSIFEMHNLGYSIPVALYARRILEKLVKYYLEKNGKPIKDNFKENYISVKSNFSSILQEVIKDYYSITSDSIHNFTELETKPISSLLIDTIIYELTEIHNQLEKEKTSKKLAEEIKKLRS
ncbi:MAG: hypothetical protein ACOCUI_03315, partial [bacterium]